MQSLGIIREFKTQQFRVIVDAIEDDCNIDDLYGNDQPELRQELLDNLNSGKWYLFCARARVFLNGAELANDYLGGCIYASLEDFREPRGYFADMVHNVCREARATLRAHRSIRVREQA